MLQLKEMFEKLFATIETMEEDEFSMSNDIGADMVDFLKYYYGNMDISLAFYTMFIVMYSLYVTSTSYGGTLQDVEDAANNKNKTMAKIIEFDKFRKK